MKTLALTALVLLLSACAGGLGKGGNSEMYGEIKGGVETGHTRVGH